MSLSSMCQKGGQIMPVTLLLVLSPIFKMQSTPHFTLFKPRGTDYARHTTASPPYSKCNLHLVHPIQTKGADYAHHNTMGLVWLKFKLAPLCMVSIQEQVMMARI